MGSTLIRSEQTDIATDTITMTNKTLTSPVVGGAGATGAGTLGYSDTDHNLLVGGAGANNVLFVNHWKAFTPSWTNLTVGAGGAVDAAYSIIGKTVFVRVQFTFGTGSAISGRVSFNNLPYAAKIGTSCVGHILDANVGWYKADIYAASTTCYVDALTAGGTYVAQAYFSSTIPMTWVSTDMFGFTITYETT